MVKQLTHDIMSWTDVLMCIVAFSSNLSSCQMRSGTSNTVMVACSKNFEPRMWSEDGCLGPWSTPTEQTGIINARE